MSRISSFDNYRPALFVSPITRNINIPFIKNYFNNSGLGRVGEVVVRAGKSNEYAIVHFERWNLKESVSARETLVRLNELRMYYDRAAFWKVSEYNASKPAYASMIPRDRFRPVTIYKNPLSTMSTRPHPHAAQLVDRRPVVNAIRQSHHRSHEVGAGRHSHDCRVLDGLILAVDPIVPQKLSFELEMSAKLDEIEKQLDECSADSVSDLSTDDYDAENALCDETRIRNATVDIDTPEEAICAFDYGEVKLPPRRRVKLLTRAPRTVAIEAAMASATIVDSV
jgi:hypothetical protein